MILRKTIPILIACSCLLRITAAQEVSPSPPTIPPSSTVEHTQDFSEIVVPISSLKITPIVILGRGSRPVPSLNIDSNFGTGFCLDAACHFIATNYHVAVTTRVHRIKRDKIIKRYFATGPQDKGATANITEDGNVLPYVMRRDLAIFQLRRSLPHHHGLAYSLAEPEVGQEVDIYGFPRGLQQKGTINHSRQLTRFPATFKAHTTSGLLAFDYELAHNSQLVKGASGGIVVDRKTEKIIGIMNASNDKMAVAVPVQALVDFVSKVQPFLAQKIFPTSVLSVSADLYPKFMPRPDHDPKFVPLVADGLQHRPEEPPEVKVLRDKAHHLADSIRNFIAVQSFEWGKGDNESVAEAEFQVRVIDGVQRFRRYPDGKREYEEVPSPRWNDWVLPADEWSKLPKMVGTEFRLKVHQAAEVVVNEQRMKVFQYYSSVEDNLCPFAPVEDYGLFTISETVAVACYGEVWTDEDMNIMRMSEHLELSDKLKAYRGWEECQVVLTYGWLKRAGEPPRLVPLTVFTEARYKKKEIYWCRGQFTDYHIFDSDVKIVAN
jgi:hypothetical protein